MVSNSVFKRRLKCSRTHAGSQQRPKEGLDLELGGQGAPKGRSRSAKRDATGRHWGLVGPVLRAQEAQKVSTAAHKARQGLQNGPVFVKNVMPTQIKKYRKTVGFTAFAKLSTRHRRDFQRQRCMKKPPKQARVGGGARKASKSVPRGPSGPRGAPDQRGCPRRGRGGFPPPHSIVTGWWRW